MYAASVSDCIQTRVTFPLSLQTMAQSATYLLYYSLSSPSSLEANSLVFNLYKTPWESGILYILLWLEKYKHCMHYLGSKYPERRNHTMFCFFFPGEWNMANKIEKD